MSEALIDIRNLTVRLATGGRQAVLVDDVSFTVAKGEVLCIVGESGCGKTVTARSVIGLTRHDPRFHLTGKIHFGGRDLIQLGPNELRQVQGDGIAMIFQDPMTSLNPLHRIGRQIGEVLALHTKQPRAEIRRRTLELLRQVGIPNSETRIDDYPHQFSGGMRQRAMIAMALACSPSLLIADEPTTALDVTTQKQILTLIKRLKTDYGMGLILITHDLGIVAEIADRVMVMYAGRCVEIGAVRALFRTPQHPYTAGLLASIPAANRQRGARLPSIRGVPPILSEGTPQGCAFLPRCDFSFAQCRSLPPLKASGAEADHLDRCWLSPEVKAQSLDRLQRAGAS